LQILEFDFPGSWEPDKPFNYPTLAAMVTSFPNLQTIAFNTSNGHFLQTREHRKDFAVALERIISAGTIKTVAISEGSALGAGGDHLDALAIQHGVRLYRAYGWHQVRGLVFGSAWKLWRGTMS